MGTGLRKIILDEDEDEFIPTIYDIYHESNIMGRTDPYWVQQHMGYVFLPEASPGMPAITSSKVQGLQVWWRGVWGDHDDPYWGHCGYRRNSISAGHRRALAVLTADTVLLTELGGVKICE